MIPFTTCLRLNRKRHKEGRQQQSSGTATEELVAKPTTSLGEASKAEQEFDREVEESLEARRCAWRVMEQRMAEPGAKKIIPPAMTTTTKTTTIHTSHGRPSIQVDVDIHSTDEEEKTKVTTDTADCSMRALMLMKSIDLTDEVGSFTLSVGRRRSSSSIRFADDTDTGTDILIITEEDLEEILSDPVYGCSPIGQRSSSQRRQSSHSLLSEEAYAAIPAPIAQHRRLMRGRRSLISPSVHRQLLQSGGVFGMSVGGTGAVAYSPSLEGKSKTQSTRLLLALRRRKSLSRSIHMDPIALLDFSYDKIVKRLLQSSSSWKFSSFTLDTLTGGHSLSTLLVHLFQSYGLVDHFKLDMLCLWKCFHLFEQGYHDTNPYHNSVHAADVTQAMHCFIQEKKIGPFLTPMETMCAILAAVAHDLDHPGVNQHFLIATNSHLAALYNNVSVLESHHWRFAISCIKESQLFSHFSQEQWAQIRHLLKSLILATDITQQAGYLIHFRKCLQQAPTASLTTTSSTSTSTSTSPSSSSSSSPSSSSSSSSSDEKKKVTTSLPEPSSGLSMSLPENRLFILKIALKCADLANPCRSWQLSRRWSEQICSEFYRQGDYERQLNLPVTPIFNRYEASMAKIQTDFFQNVVTPLFELWDQFLASDLSSQLIANLNFNYNQWLSFLNKKMINRRHSMISSVSPELGMITIAKRRAPTTTSSTATRTSVQLECPFYRHRSLGALTMLQPPSSLSEAKSILRPKPPSSLPTTSRTRQVQAHTIQIATATTLASSSAAASSSSSQASQVEREESQEVNQPRGPQSPAPESRQFQCDGIHGCGTPSSLGSPRSEDFSDPSSIASGSADDVDIDPLSQRHPLTSHVSEEEGFSSPDEEALDHLDDHPAAVHGLAAAAIPSGLSAGITLHSSHPLSPLSAQMFLDRGQYLGGRRGSAPGCIGVYASAELAAAALVFLQGALTNSTAAVPRRSSAPVEAGRGSFNNHHYGHHYHHHNQNNRKNSNNSNRSHRSDETHNAVNRQKAMGWTNPYGQGKRGRSMEVLTVSQSTAEA